MSKSKNRPMRWAKLSIGLLLIAGVLVGGFLGLRRTSKPVVKYSGPIERISAGVVGEYSSLVIIAQDKGYFVDNGLDVTTKDYESGPPAVADLLAGKVDVATAADFVGVRNSFGGEDLKILATTAKVEAFYLAVRADHKISKPADLKGKRIGITAKTAGEFYMGQFLSFNSLSALDITIINQPPAKLLEMVEKGELDGVVTFEPHIYQLQTRLGSKIMVWPVQNGQKLYAQLYGTGKLTTERPEALKRYIKALVQAEQFAKNNDAQARAIIKQRLKYDDAYMGHIWPKFSFTVSLDQELLLIMDDEARWAIENRLTTAAKAPNYLRLMYFDALESVKPEAITVIR